MTTTTPFYKTAPKPHQRDALFKSARKREFALFMGPGTGKTKVLIDTAAYLYEQGAIDTLLVFGLNGPHMDVVDEVAKHLPDRIDREAAYFLGGGAGYIKKADREAWERAVRATKVLRILVFHHDILKYAKGTAYIRSLVARRKVLGALDESHKFRTPKAKRTRACWHLGRILTYRRILTGTPINKNLHNLYAQYKFLDPKIIGMPTYTAFKARYCIERGQFHQIVGYQNEDELFEKVRPYTFQVLRSDCTDLPQQPWPPQQIHVSLSAEQRRIYNELRREYVAEVRSGLVLEEQMAGTRILRLQQIIAGHVPTGEDEQKWEPIPCPRLETAVDLADGADGKVIIWCRFRPDVVQLSAALERAGIDHVAINGATPKNQIPGLIDRWRKKSECKVMVATMSKLGTSYTFNEATTVIWYSVGVSYEMREQSRARNDRYGQTGQVAYYDLIAPGTLDAKNLRRFEETDKVASLFADQRRYQELLEAE